ncbi:MAG: Asp23/Gls24 family envelope stress response protein [Lachnospiraceae bacterium]|nr:Asp23/Gls24 family envelope stress response protein [Lachnospiraceae bacterium]
MKGRMDNDMGSIVIDREVLAKYAGSAATECFGVVGMASVNVKDGVAKLLKRENISRGVNVSVVENRIRIQLHVIVAYGVSIRAVAQNILENVRCRVETYTGMEVDNINVIVEGVRIVDD